MRFAIVGLGWAARALHLPALGRVPAAELVGGCDQSPEQRGRWTRETGLAAHAELDALVAETRPDALIVATPPGSHAPLCLAALEHGLHVMCEKPFADSAEDAQAVIDAAARADRAVAVNHPLREEPIFKAVADAIASGEHGRLAFCQVWQLMDLPPWQEATAWRAAMPNRMLFEGGVHLVDLLLTLYGEVPAAVSAQHSAGLGDGPQGDAVQLVTLEFAGGRLAQIVIDRLCKGGTRYVEVRADCERSSLRASIGGRAYLRLGKKRAERAGLRLELARGGVAWSEQGLRRKTLAKNPPDAAVLGTARLLEGFVAAVREGREPPSSARTARDGLAVIEAAYLSADTGERVEMRAAAGAGARALSA